MKKFISRLAVLVLAIALLVPVVASAQENASNPGGNNSGSPTSIPTKVCVQINRTLNLGSRDWNTNGEVTVLQNFLISQGYLSGSPTGYYGTATRNAVRKLQVAAGIAPANGITGPITRAYINGQCSPTPVVAVSVVTPNGGETYTAGKEMTVTWKSKNTPVDAVTTIALAQLDNGQLYYNYYLLDSYCTGASDSCVNFSEGKANIKIPAEVKSGQYKIRVVCSTKNSEAYCDSVNNSVRPEDLSDNFFKITTDFVQPSITVVSPNGGETLAPSTKLTANWKYTGKTDNASHFPKFAVDILDEYGNRVKHATNQTDGFRTIVAWDGSDSYTIPLVRSLSDGKYKLAVGVCPANGDPSLCFSPKMSELINDTSDSYFTITSNSQPPVACYTFTRNLTVGSRGEDVVKLQDFLTSKGFSPLNNNTIQGYFSVATQRALAQYQASVGISPANGYFGPISRMYVGNELCGTAVGVPVIDKVSGTLYPSAFNYAYGKNFKGVTSVHVIPVGGNVKYGFEYAITSDSQIRIDPPNAPGLPVGEYVLYITNQAGTSKGFPVKIGSDVGVGTSNLAVVSSPANPPSQVYYVNPNIGLQGATMMNFDVKSTNGDSRINSVTMNWYISNGPGYPTAFYLFDGSTMLASIATNGEKRLTFNNLNLVVPKDTTKTLTIKGDFPGNMAQGATVTVTESEVKYSQPNGASSVNYSVIQGSPHMFSSASANWQFVSGTASTVSNSAGVTSNVVGAIVLKVKPIGGTMALPTVKDIGAMITSSADGDQAMIQMVSVQGNPSILYEGAEYVVTVSLAGMPTFPMPSMGSVWFKINRLSAVIGGKEIVQNTGLENFKTPSVIVSGGATPTYPGFNISLDKSSYTPTDTVEMKIGRADNSSVGYGIDVQIVNGTSNVKTVFKNISIGQAQVLKINLNNYGVTAGDYIIRSVGSGQVINAGVNTNAVTLNVKNATVVAPTATITSANQTSSLTPVVSGTANGTASVGVVLSNSGGKIFGSGLIPVVNGRWSVLVSSALTAGEYTLVVYDANNNALEKGPLLITRIAGDINGDGRVTQADMNILSAAYGTKTGDAKYNAAADLNKDGAVNFDDLASLAQKMGHGVVTTSLVPLGGDCNGDNTVDFSDLSKIAQIFGSKIGDGMYHQGCDSNLDGYVDQIDMDILSSNYGKTLNTGTAVGGAVQGVSTATSCVVLTQALQRGSMDIFSDGEVTLLQSFLETQGYGFPDKGTFGPMTESSLKAWQGKQGISQTGITGPLTREAISNVSCK